MVVILDKTALGYLFECKTDNNGAIGVVGGFKSVLHGTEARVKLTCMVDNSGRIVMPAVNNLSLGFVPLGNVCQTEEEVDVFVKSNKSFFGKFGEFALVAHGVIILDTETDTVKSTKSLGLYVPKTITKDQTDAGGTKLVCEKLSLTSGIHDFTVSASIYQGYIDNMMKDITVKSTRTKADFLKSLVFRGK